MVSAESSGGRLRTPLVTLFLELKKSLWHAVDESAGCVCPLTTPQTDREQKALILQQTVDKAVDTVMQGGAQRHSLSNSQVRKNMPMCGTGCGVHDH